MSAQRTKDSAQMTTYGCARRGPRGERAEDHGPVERVEDHEVSAQRTTDGVAVERKRGGGAEGAEGGGGGAGGAGEQRGEKEKVKDSAEVNHTTTHRASGFS